MVSSSLWGIQGLYAKRFMGFSMGREFTMHLYNPALLIYFPLYCRAYLTLNLRWPMLRKNRFLHIGYIQLKFVHPVGNQDITHYKYLVSGEPRHFTYSILI